MMTNVAGLQAPNLKQSLDFDALVQACPETATAKGMFLQDLSDTLKQHKLPHPTEKFLGFKDYPYRRYIGLIAEAVRGIYPTEPPLVAMRTLSRNAYPTLAQSMVGRVVFGVLGNDPEKVLRLAAKGFALAMSGCSCTVEVERGRALATLSGIHLPIEAQIGVFEGAINACGKQLMATRTRRDGDNAGLIELTWS
jgi:uncharacterized protein (TIGR02265 family)